MRLYSQGGNMKFEETPFGTKIIGLTEALHLVAKGHDKFMDDYPIKVCDYCFNKGKAYTFLLGETICPLCLKDFPSDITEARQKIHALRQRVKSLEAEHVNLVGAAREVIRISDRKHEAWDRLKTMIGIPVPNTTGWSEEDGFLKSE